jgi:uncharacterized protein YbjT (DUF2867 family)
MTKSSAQHESRAAVLAGASGLVGRALLELLLESPRYRSVQALLRRSTPGLPIHRKLAVKVVDFDEPPTLAAVDDVFIALGTTIDAAGSREAFRRVDFDMVLAVAQAGRRAGAQRLLVVSALGADPRSAIFYNRVKGDMEQAVQGLGYASVVIARPSLLVGDRAALGQPSRRGEGLALRLFGPVLRWIPRGVRPIGADEVARALLRAALEAQPGVRILQSGDMQTGAAPR